MKIPNPILSTVEEAVQDEMRKAGREVLKDARTRAPKDTGALRKTGRVNVDDLTVQVSFNGKVAAIQHENLDFQHPTGGEAKFLENAALDFDLEGAIARGVRSALDG
ncbi:HK97 gp10 family phage protein [Microbacterium halophytorum]|uniref:HK97 gp10 family phage protein n=1 Tax=Microbacterium halophytorum TaxID=2067568 RepID=UPI000CFC9FFB|nr:HK97 gp10 family phage protein [Microbacterium halophytorum]